MVTNFNEILCCPVSGQDLVEESEGLLRTVDGKRQYLVQDGIYDFLSDSDTNSLNPSEEKTIVAEFYEDFGWAKTEDGLYNDSARFATQSKLGRKYTIKCNRRIKSHFQRGGRYFLDAGSGAIPWPEYLEFHEKYDIRICVDMSRAALLEAKKKLGEKGRYIRADLTQLPFKIASIDAASSNHVIYHIPADEQAKAFVELSRVLSPDGKAAIAYSWSYSPLAWRIRKFFQLLSGGRAVEKAKSTGSTEEMPNIYFHPHSLEWFQSRSWPFEYEIRPFRLIDNPTMDEFFRDNLLWRAVVRGLLLFQAVFPKFSGYYGQYPLIVLHSSNKKHKTHTAPPSN